MTYPNVLVMSYLKETRQLTPEWRMKLENAIGAGWQRLLTFRTKDGGFDWYGRDPGKILLTAYGVMELSDMNRVYPIDQRVIDDAVKFLFSRMKEDHWEMDLPAHSWSQVGGSVAVTAYVAWALNEAHVNDPRLAAAVLWLSSQKPEDAYIMALVALATSEGAEGLEAKLSPDGRLLTKLEGAYYARGDAASIEATALGTLALIRGKRPVDRPLAALIRAKDPEGGWHSTQATILAIKALLEASHAAPPSKPVRVLARVNGHDVAFDVDAKNFDVVQEADVSKWLAAGANIIEAAAGDFHPNLQIAGRFYRPWSVVEPAADSPLAIDVQYDKTRLTREDVLKASVKMTYTGPGTFMVIADLGTPPGFDVDPEAFERMAQQKLIDKYSLAGRQITLYFGRVTKEQVIAFDYSLRPRFPVRAQSPRSSAYEYYTPANQGSGKPTRLEVLEKR